MSTCPTSPTAFTADGDLTGPEVARLAEQLWPHLLSAPPRAVVDLRASSSLDDAGVDLIAAAHTYAQHRGLELRIINAAPQLRRVLSAAGVPASAPTPVPNAV